MQAPTLTSLHREHAYTLTQTTHMAKKTKNKNKKRVYPERKSQHELGKKFQGHHDWQDSWALGCAMWC